MLFRTWEPFLCRPSLAVLLPFIFIDQDVLVALWQRMWIPAQEPRPLVWFSSAGSVGKHQGSSSVLVLSSFKDI